MLYGIDSLLDGKLLDLLHQMGHGDELLIADANYPSHSRARHIVSIPGSFSPDVLAAIRTVIPADAYEGPSVLLMQSEQDTLLQVQNELIEAASVETERVELLDRFDFYEKADGAFLTIRTGEARTYANVILRKGVVPVSSALNRPAPTVGPKAS